MRFGGIVIFIVGLGLGLAAGGYFMPEVNRWVATAGSTIASSQPDFDGGAAASGHSGNSITREALSSPASASESKDLATLAEGSEVDFFSYHRIKEVMDFAETLNADEMPGTMQQLEALPD